MGFLGYRSTSSAGATWIPVLWRWQKGATRPLTSLYPSALRPETKLPLHAPLATIQARPLSFGRILEKAKKMAGDDYEKEKKRSRKTCSFGFKDLGPIPHSHHTKKYPITLPLPRKVLKEDHGYLSFRGEQEKVIARLQEKGSTIHMMRTGGGKSLIYQLLARTIPDEGLILVVEPSISLLRDQVKAAKAVGIAAEGVDGTMSQNQLDEVIKRLRRRKIRMLFTPPERLHTRTGFLKDLSLDPLLMLVIDEAHLIPLEGPNFRTSFLDLAAFYHLCPPQHLLVTTSTATEGWLDDLACAFQIPQEGVFRAERVAEKLRKDILDIEARAYHARVHSKIALKGKGRGSKFEYDQFKHARRLNFQFGNLQQLFKILELKEDYQYLEHVFTRMEPHAYTIRQPKLRKGQRSLLGPDEIFAAVRNSILAKDSSVEASMLLDGSWHRQYLREIERFEIIYKAVEERASINKYDSEFLCKLAFGVTSPRLITTGLSSRRIAGSLAHWPYDDLHRAFKVFVDRKRATDFEEDTDEDDGDTTGDDSDSEDDDEGEEILEDSDSEDYYSIM